MTLLIGGYLLLAAALVYLSAELGDLVDLLDKKTSMASAFIGGVLLAAVTSLPEMFTSLTSVISIGKPGLVIGNILGSNLFNVFALGVVCLLFMANLRKSKVTASHKITMTSALGAYILLTATIFVGDSSQVLGVSMISLFIFMLYCWSIRSMSTDEDTGSDEDTSSLTLKQVVIRFVLFAVLLVTASIVITYLSDLLSSQFGWGATYAGALLLGIVTSLPELISCIVLAKKGNFNAVIGNIVGSCMFNFAILLMADIAYTGGSIYTFDVQSKLLIGLGAIGCAGVLAQIVVLCKTNDKMDSRKPAVLGMLSVVPVVAYLTFVVAGGML